MKVTHILKLNWFLGNLVLCYYCLQKLHNFSIRKFTPIGCKISFGILMLFLSACSSSVDKVDVDAITIPWKVKQFNRDLFDSSVININVKVEHLAKKYGDFYNLFTARVLNIGRAKDATTNIRLQSFITDTDINKVRHFSDSIYSDFPFYENKLHNSFKRLHYYFPTKQTPQIITFISGFNYGLLALDSSLAIGLDMFLGKDFIYYKRLELPSFQRINMSPDHLVVSSIKAWTITEFEQHTKTPNFLETILYEGKLMYLLDLTNPQESDAIKIGYTTAQLKWCVDNEAQIWTHFIESKLLYETGSKKIRSYINNGPFTTGFDKSSPAKTGVWIGWQIIRKFMENNTDITPEKLMKINDYQYILNHSKYKPKK